MFLRDSSQVLGPNMASTDRVRCRAHGWKLWPWPTTNSCSSPGALALLAGRRNGRAASNLWSLASSRAAAATTSTGGYSLLCGEHQRRCATAPLASRHACDERDQVEQVDSITDIMWKRAFPTPSYWQSAFEVVFAVLTWRVTPDAFLANQLLNLCDLDAAFHVLQQIRPQIQLDVISYNVVLSLASRNAAWHQAIQLAEVMATNDQALDDISATCLCDAAKKVQRWRCAASLAIGSESLAPWNSVATAARRAQRWPESLALSTDLQQRFIETDLSSFNEEVGAWGLTHWPKALSVAFSKPRDEVTLTVLLSSLLNARRFKEALVLLDDPTLIRDPVNHYVCLRAALEAEEDEVVMNLLERLRFQGISLVQHYVAELIDQASRSMAWKVFRAAPGAKAASLWLIRWPRWSDASELLQILGQNAVDGDGVLAADVLRCFWEKSLPWAEGLAMLRQMWRNHVRLDVKSSNSIADSGISASCWHISIDLLQSMNTRRQTWSLVSYSTLMAASEWIKTLLVLKQMREAGLQLDNIGFNGALRSMVASSWQQVTALMLAEEASGSIPELRTYSALLSCCGWREATRIVMRMMERQVVPDRIASDIALGAVSQEVEKVLELLVLLQHQSIEVGTRAAISSCATAARWATSLHILSGAEEDVVSYGATIASCEKAQRWEVAVLLLWRMVAGTSPIFNSCISACRRGKQWHSALDLVEQLHLGSKGTIQVAMDVIEFGLLGDSSIYTKRANKKKSWVSSQLRPHLPGKLHVQAFYGGGVKELKAYLEQGRVFETLGISYFGSEHTDRPMNKSMYFNMWKELFKLLRKYVLKHVIFFMGGYAAKYGYCQAYDDNMLIIRKWIRDVGGFEVRTDFARVQTWPLAADKLHFDVECLPQLAEYWKQLLLKLPPNMSGPQPPPGPPPKRCYEESSGQGFSKRARVSEEGRHYSHHVRPKDGVNICISDDDADDSPGNESWHDSGPRKASFSWQSRANPQWRGDKDITISDESGEDWQPRMQSWRTSRQHSRYERNGRRGSVSKSESPHRPHPPHLPPPNFWRTAKPDPRGPNGFRGDISVSDAESEDWLPPADRAHRAAHGASHGSLSEAARGQRYDRYKRPERTRIATTHLGASSLPVAPSYPSRW
eukprot:symbB.v1.2.012556.t1/scaffold836.1/size159045/2